MPARPWWLLPPGRLNSMWWIVLGAGMLWFDYMTGPSAMFPVIYAVPVILAAWYSGRGSALALALVVPLMRLIVLMMQTSGENFTSLAMATLLRGVVVAFIALWFARLAELERDLHHQVKVLEGLLPICSFCKSIRTERGDWEPLEAFISGRSAAEFSHGVCPTCSVKHYPTYFDQRA